MTGAGRAELWRGNAILERYHVNLPRTSLLDAPPDEDPSLQVGKGTPRKQTLTLEFTSIYGLRCFHRPWNPGLIKNRLASLICCVARRLSSSGLPIERKTPVRPGRAEHLALARLGKPLGGPEGLVRLAMCSHTGVALDRPDFDLTVHGPAEEEFARVAPVHRHDPGGVAGQVADVLAVFHVVERDDSGVACCG